VVVVVLFCPNFLLVCLVCPFLGSFNLIIIPKNRSNFNGGGLKLVDFGAKKRENFNMRIYRKKRSWTDDQLKIAVKDSTNYRQVILKLGLKPAGGNYDQVKKYISELKLDAKHFNGKGWSKGKKGIGKPRIALRDILKRGTYFQSYKLKKRLFKAGVRYKWCEECGWEKRTVDGYLPLELDHINGDKYDNRLENLRILCPNCHSLKPTHRGRNKLNAH